mgnify:CR=1 FL=1
MHDSINPILDYLEDPHALEVLYRRDEQRFRSYFNEVYSSHPDSIILRVWSERLQEMETNKQSWFDCSFITMGILSISAALVLRLLIFLVNEFNIAPINVLFGILPFMSVYLILSQNESKRLRWFVFCSTLALMIYFNLIPNDARDSVILSYLHLPILLWLLLGISHAGNHYVSTPARVAFLKFNGEFLVLYILFALGGLALSGITMMLFSLLGLNISEFYFENIVVMGVAGLAIVATYAVQRYGRLTQSIAPLIAKVFSPLVLLTLITYLITMLVMGKNPFMDRDFLISFNVILFVVLAITIYLITERSPKQSAQIMDGINFALIICALIINAIALIAMVFRLTSFGITPNRLASFVINMLIMMHLVRIGIANLSYLRHKSNIERLQAAVTSWLPIYGLWALIVVFSFPFIF